MIGKLVRKIAETQTQLTRIESEMIDKRTDINALQNKLIKDIDYQNLQKKIQIY